MRVLYSRTIIIVLLSILLLFLLYTLLEQQRTPIDHKIVSATYTEDGSLAGGTSGRNASLVTPTRPPDDYLIPPDTELATMNENQWMQIYWKYINRLQILCRDVVRMGSLKDGGKEICVDEPYRPSQPCIVYSFGINYLFDFDKAMEKHFGCHIYCFDPSMTNKSTQVSNRIWFYRLGLGATDGINRLGWQINTLDTIRAKLGHTNATIDVLKIDIEGDEWASLLQMIPAGSLRGVKQISMETHFSRDSAGSAKYWGNDQTYRPLSALRQLYEYGFRIFMRERNEWSFQLWPGIDGMIANVNEISLIKI